MENKLQELTDRIYQEGIAKADEEKQKIIVSAQKEADRIIRNANTDADRIIRDAAKKAEDMKKNADAEIMMAAQQALSSLKQKIVDLLLKTSLSKPLKKGFDDVAFIQKIIATMVKNWSHDKTESPSLSLLLPKDMAAEFESFISSKGHEQLKAGLTIEYSSNLKKGFRISPKDGSFKISFTDEDFESFFKEYLRPRTIKALYGEE